MRVLELRVGDARDALDRFEAGWNRRAEGRKTGALRVLSISIEPALFTSGDREMLQDLTAAAVNAAIANAQRLMQEEVQKASTALGLPLTGGAKPA